MTTRERYTGVLTKKHADGMVWAPNIDHWYNTNKANGTLPDELRSMSRNEILREEGAAIWSRANILKAFTPNVDIKKVEIPSVSIRTIYETPLGKVETMHQYAEDTTHALFLKEHMIKSVEDIPIVKFIVEDTQYQLDEQPFIQSEKEVGEDGISLVVLPYSLPYIQYGRTDAGWENGIYLWSDYQDEVEELLDTYYQKSIECVNMISKCSAWLIHSDDNMDELTTPPSMFKKYAIPYYKRVSEILHRAGKTFEVHWCGRTKHLLQYVEECGIDVVEAVSVKPMADLTIPEAFRLVGENVVIQGGIPSVLMCEQTASRQEFNEYVDELLKNASAGYRFILGMGDNVPPDADFYRVKEISNKIKSL